MSRTVSGVLPSIVALAGGVVISVALSGCVIRIEGTSAHQEGRATFESTQVSVVEHRPGTGMEVKTRSGSVAVKRTSRDDVHVEGTVACVSRERADRTRILASRGPGGTLRIGVAWADGRRESGERCSFRIEVPGADGVRIETQHGTIDVEGLRGEADLRTSFGSVRVSDHEGPLRVRTSHGGIRAVRVGGELDVETSFGKVEVELAHANRGPVRMVTSHGAISFWPGAAFEGEVELRTSHASIDLVGADEPRTRPVRLHSLSASEAKITIGSGEGRSRIETSFGGITVDLRPRE